MTPVRLEPAASGSRVKHSTTEPLRSPVASLDMMLSNKRITKEMCRLVFIFVVRKPHKDRFSCIEANFIIPIGRQN